MQMNFDLSHGSVVIKSHYLFVYNKKNKIYNATQFERVQQSQGPGQRWEAWLVERLKG